MALLALGPASILPGQTVTNWTGAGNDNWTISGNWSNGVPNTATSIAQFNSSTADSPIVNSNTTLGELVFTSAANAQTFAGTRTLTLAGIGGVGLDNQGAQTQAFGNKFALSGSQTWQSLANTSALVFNGNVALGTGNTLTLGLAATGASAMTFNAALSGTTANLVIGGHGTALINAAATYTGTTTINSGATLQMTGAGVLSNSTNVTVNAGGTYDLNGLSDTVATIAGGGDLKLGAATLTLSGANSTTFSGAISGGGGLDKQGTANLTLAGNNTFTGGFKLDAGTVTVGHASAFGAGTLTLSGGTLSAGNDYLLANPLALEASTAISAADGVDLVFSSDSVATTGGTLTLGNTTGSGLTSVGFSGSGFDFSRPIALADAFTQLRGSNAAGTQTFSGAISGAGSFRRDSTGTTILSGNNTFTGGVTLAGGTLVVGSNTALGNSAGPLALAGGTLTSVASRTLANPVTLSANSTISAADTFAFTFSNDTISATGGTLKIDNTSNSGTMAVGFSGSGFDFSGRVNLSDAFTELRFLNTSGTQTFSGRIAGSGLVRRDAAGGTTILSGNNTYTTTTFVDAGTLALGASGNATNTPLGTTAAGTIVASGASLDLNGYTLGAAEALTLSGAGVGGNGALTNSTGAAMYNGVVTLGTAAAIGGAGDITLSSGLAGDFALTKVGAGTLTLDAASARTAATAVSGGTLVLGDNAALGSGALTINDAMLSSAANRTLANDLVVGTANATISAANGVGFSFSGAISGGSGDRLNLVNASGAGAMTVAFTNPALSYNRALDLGAFTELHLQNPTGTQTLSGVLSGTGTLVRDVAGGATTISGNNAAFAGDTRLTAGTIVVGHDAAFGTGTLVLDGGTLSATADRTIAGPLTLAASSTISAGAGVDFEFSGNAIATNAGTLTLGNTDGSGVMSVGFSGNGINFTRPVALADAFSELRFLNPSGTQTFSGAISGAGSVRQNGAGGTVLLSGNNSYTGATTIVSGTLQLGSAGSGGNSPLGTVAGGTTVANGGTLDLNGITLGTAEAVGISGAGATGAGALVNNGAPATFNGIVTLNANAALGGSGDLTLTAGLAGNNGLTKTGAGSLTLNAPSTRAGNTTLDLGTLRLGSATGLGAASQTLTMNAGTLDLAIDSSVGAYGVVVAGNATILSDKAAAASTGITHTLGTLKLDNGSTLTVDAGSNVGSGTAGLAFGAATLLATNGTFDVAGGASLTLASLNGNGLDGTITGAGPTTINGNVRLGTGTLTKRGASTLTLNGANSIAGAVQLNAGALTLGSSAALAIAALDASAGTTLTVGAGGVVNVNPAAATTSVFSGALAGAGTLALTGAASDAMLVFDATTGFDASALSLTLNGGTLRFTGGGTFTFGTIHITGDTILDFDNSIGTVLSSSALVIDSGVTVTINNWAYLGTSWYVRNSFSGATPGQMGGPPLNQIAFTNNPYPGWFQTTWTGNLEIRPMPEPAIFGAILLAALLTLYGGRCLFPPRR